MAAAPSEDDMITCPLCQTMMPSNEQLQLHYLQSCPGYDKEGLFTHNIMNVYYIHNKHTCWLNATPCNRCQGYGYKCPQVLSSGSSFTK